MEEIEEGHAFHRMSSQRRRKLWSLAARAAAKCTDEVPLPTEAAGTSPFWSKDSLVKTQDSGVSVDLHSDGLQRGSWTASFGSATQPQQRFSFEHRHPSPLVSRSPRTGPRRLYSDHDVLMNRLGSGCEPFESLAIAVPLDMVDPGVRSVQRIVQHQARKRKVSSQLWGSADTSGLGSSLDWASIETGQQPIRHASTSFLQPPRLSCNPVATRSLDEPLSCDPAGAYFQSSTAVRGPTVQMDHRTERHVTSMHNSPVGMDRRTGSIQPGSPYFRPIHRIGANEAYGWATARADRFRPGFRRAPYLVTRSLDQADGTSFALESTSPRVYQRPVLHQSLPGAIGSIAPHSLSRMNPRSACCSMLSNATDRSQVWWQQQQQGYGQRGPGPIVSSAPPPPSPPVPTLPQPYMYYPGYPVPSLCEQATGELEQTAGDSAPRHIVDYEPPPLTSEGQRREQWNSRAGSIYRRSRTLDETGGPRPRVTTDRRRTLVMYSVPPPTDELSPLAARMVMVPGQSPVVGHPGYDSDYMHPRTALWKANIPGVSAGLTAPGHRVRYSREEPILEDWDAEQERRIQAPAVGDVRVGSGQQPWQQEKNKLTEEKVIPTRVCAPQSSQQTRASANLETSATLRTVQPCLTSPSTDAKGPPETVIHPLAGVEKHQAVSCTRRTAQDGSVQPGPSHLVSRDPSIPVSPASSASDSAAAELRCIQARQNKARSSSNNRPLVNPTFLSPGIGDRQPADRKDQERIPDHGGDLSVSELTDHGTKPIALPSALKNHGNGLILDKSRPRPPEKRVSLEDDLNPDADEEDRRNLRESSTSTHLFIDPKILILEGGSPDLHTIEGPEVESDWLSDRKSARDSQTPSTAFGTRGMTTAGGTTVPYDQSRLAIHITTSEVDQFAEYWDHSVFAAARISAVGLATVATVCLLCSTGASTWIYQGTEENRTHSGFWKRCNYVNQTCEFTVPFLTKRDGWQDGALCILILAILLGILGTSLALAGHVVFALSKRLYYFHSSGEAHVVAAFVTAFANLIYHITALVHLQSDAPVYFGAAYGVSWFACFLHLICALLLSLDEVLHRLAVLSVRFVCIRYCMHGLIRCYARAQAKRRAFHASQALRRKRRLEAQSHLK